MNIKAAIATIAVLIPVIVGIFIPEVFFGAVLIFAGALIIFGIYSFFNLLFDGWGE
jgi:hypothetical protein